MKTQERHKETEADPNAYNDEDDHDYGQDDDIGSSFSDMLDNIDEFGNIQDTELADKELDEAGATDDPNEDLYSLDWLETEEDDKEDKTKTKVKTPEPDPSDTADTTEDDLDISGEEIVRRDGKPVSVETSVAFHKIKEQRNKERSRAEQAEKERDQLKKDLNTIDYRNTDDFNRTFNEPIKKMFSDATKWIHGASKDNLPQIQNQIAQATTALNRNDESGFFETVDGISSQLSAVAGNKFSGIMANLWDKVQERNEAYVDSDKAAKRVQERRLQQLPMLARSLDDILDADFQSMSTTDPIVAFYRQENVKDRFKFDETVPVEINSIKAEMKNFAATGVITPVLSKAILSAAQMPIRDQERKMLVMSLTKMNEDLSLIKKEKEAIQAKLDKIVGKGRSRVIGKESVDEALDDDFGYGMSSVYD